MVIPELDIEEKTETRLSEADKRVQALEAQLKVDHYDVEAARKLGSLIAETRDVARTGAAYERVTPWRRHRPKL